MSKQNRHLKGDGFCKSPSSFLNNKTLFALIAVGLMITSVMCTIDTSEATTPTNGSSIQLDDYMDADGFRSKGATCDNETEYDHENGILTLVNFSLTASNLDSYVLRIIRDVTIVVKGSNVLNLTGNSEHNGAITSNSNHNITISGSIGSSLTISVDETKSNNDNKGINTGGTVTIDGGVNVVINMKADENTGMVIGIDSNNTSIKNNSVVFVNIASNSNLKDIFGIRAKSNNLVISDSNVTVNIGGGKRDFNGLQCSNLSIERSNIAISVEGSSDSNNTRAIYATGEVKITDSSLDARAGTGKALSYAIESKALTIKNSNIIAKGETAAFDISVELTNSEYDSIKASETTTGEPSDIKSVDETTTIGNNYKIVVTETAVAPPTPEPTSNNDNTTVIVAIVLATVIPIAFFGFVLLVSRP